MRQPWARLRPELNGASFTATGRGVQDETEQVQNADREKHRDNQFAETGCAPRFSSSVERLHFYV